jgi:uncharacterized Zn-binding protein involved in type VI secretion
MPLVINMGASKTKIGNMAAARTLDTTAPCALPGCVPGGPGMIGPGSATVLIEKMPAARAGDMVIFASCVGPIPGPVGKILPPGEPTVMIGG